MTIKELVSQIAKLEGKKHEANVGDVREIVGLLSDVIFKESCSVEPSSTLIALYKNGKRRSRRKK